MGRLKRTDELLRKFTNKVVEKKTPIAKIGSEPLIIPNHSGIAVHPEAKKEFGAGGSDRDIQFNDNGAFGGDDSLTWEDNTVKIKYGTTDRITLGLQDQGGGAKTGRISVYNESDAEKIRLVSNDESFINPGLAGQVALKLGRMTSTASLSTTGTDLVIDSNGANLYLNRYADDDIVVGEGGGDLKVKYKINMDDKAEIYIDNDNFIFENITQDKQFYFYTNYLGNKTEVLRILQNGKMLIRGATSSGMYDAVCIKAVGDYSGLRINKYNDPNAHMRIKQGSHTHLVSTANIYMRPYEVYAGWFGSTYGFSLYRDKQFRFSEAGGSGAAFVFDNTYQSVPTFKLLLPDFTVGAADKSRLLLITDYGDDTYDFGHGDQANPTIIIHSSNQSQTEYLLLTHDQTDGIIDVGLNSNLRIKPNLKFDNRIISANTPQAIDLSAIAPGTDNILFTPTNTTPNNSTTPAGWLQANNGAQTVYIPYYV